MTHCLLRRAICAGLLVASLSIPAFAARPVDTGLGQAWPNAPDLSASAHWHVYVFAINGIRYVQINDRDGRVRGAFAIAGGQFLVLPMGRDAQRISTPQQPLAFSGAVVPLTAYAETVYRDNDFQLDAVPLSNGATMFTTVPTTTSIGDTPCDDPADCSGHLE